MLPVATRSAHHCSPADDWSWFQPCRCSSCCTECYIVTLVSSPHEVAGMSQINSLHLSHSPQFIDPTSFPMLSNSRGHYWSLGVDLTMWWGGIWGGKAINMFRLQSHVPPFGSLEDMWNLIYWNKTVLHILLIQCHGKYLWQWARAVITDQIMLEEHMLVYNKVSKWFGSSMN